MSPTKSVPNLGIIDPEPLGDNIYRIKGMVEKPRLEDAPSNLAVIGRYVLTPEVFAALENAKPGAIGEIQLTDAIDAVRAEQGAFACEVTADHFDVGTPLGMLKASVNAALNREDMATELKEWLKPVLNT